MPLLTHWYSRPHVSRWFGSDGPELEDLCDRRIAAWIGLLDLHPFAFVQDYDIHGWPQHHLGFLPPGSRGIDIFIGDARLIGLGHGSRLLRQHADTLLSRDVPALGIDPHPDNGAAIRANEKAGFKVACGSRDTPWGRVILMTRSVISQ